MSDNQYPIRLSPHLRKQIADTAKAMYNAGLIEGEDSAKYIRRAVTRQIEQDRRTLDVKKPTVA